MNERDKLILQGRIAVSLLLIVGAIGLAMLGLSGWGWCLFGAVITSPKE